MVRTTTDDRIVMLEAKIARLEAVIEAGGTPHGAGDAPDDDPIPFEPESSRRRLLRNVAIVTGGAVAGVLAAGAAPAAAVDDPHVVLGGGPGMNAGNYQNVSFAATQIRYLGGMVPDQTAFVFEGGATLNVNSFPYPSALGGWTTNSEKQHGVTGYTTVINGHGVVGSGHPTTGNGVLGMGMYGVLGQSTVGYGAGVRGEGVEVGVEGVISGSIGAGVRGTGGNGVVGVSIGGPGADGYGVAGSSVIGTGVVGAGQTYGLESFQSNRAALLLRADPYDVGPVRIAPPARSDFHLNGEVEYDINGDLWLCVSPGNPGAWRKLSGPSVAGAFHAVTPGRVYDSRVTNPAPGVLANNQDRTVSVAHRRDLVNGDVVETDFVPSGATAISCNVGVVDTQGSGFLTINPGGNTAINSASINWSASGQILNNGVMLTLNGSRELTVICGGGGAANVVLDITGYYR